MKLTLRDDSPGITDVPGFQAGAASGDIRQKNDDRLDVAILYSPTPCTAAGVFTQNDLCAAPVNLCKEALATGGPFHAILANSGNANAATGKSGMKDARTMQAYTARLLRIPPSSIFVCSTGRIGRALPMAHVQTGIAGAAAHLATSQAQGIAAAQAILTSDTRPKTVTARFQWKGQTLTLAGIAKGAGMIQPNMATMFAFLATDARIARPLAQKILAECVSRTFNRISVDGDMSTNDTALLLANGHSGLTISAKEPALLQLFREAVLRVCAHLAKKIVKDGERITKCVEVHVQGARTLADAEKATRAICNSLLVKSSWYGNDPNWGRVLHAAGYARIGLVEEKADLFYDKTPVLRRGKAQDKYLPRWKAIVSQDEFSITLNLNLGKASFSMLAADLTEGYVDYNKSE